MPRAGRPSSRSLGIAFGEAPILPRASPHSARRGNPGMAEELDVAGLLRPGDRLAWSAGPMEPTDLIGVLGRQLDRVPRISVLLNLSLQTTIDAARLASRATVTALGGAVTNRRFQEIGALDVLPINYSTLPDLVASGRLAIDVVLLQVAAEGDAYNLSLM